MTRSRLPKLTSTNLMGFMVLGMVIILVTCVALIPFFTSNRAAQSSIQFFNGDIPVGAPITHTNPFYTGAWYFNGEVVTKAHVVIQWKAIASEGAYVNIGAGVSTDSYEIDHFSYTNRELEGVVSFSIELYQDLQSEGLAHGDVVKLKINVTFALYTDNDVLLDSTGDLIEATLLWQDPDVVTGGGFTITSVTVTPVYDLDVTP